VSKVIAEMLLSVGKVVLGDKAASGGEVVLRLEINRLNGHHIALDPLVLHCMA
jgi:hypothetical protein